jgi:hypothetical protein
LILQSAILIHTVIVVDEGDLLRIITQPDHARFAAEMLSLWRADGIPEHPRREELLFAVREHDNGWREADAAPWIDPATQRPYDFSSFPDSERLEIWKRGILRFADQHPYSALLIAEHAEIIHQPLSDDWRDLFGQIESLRQEWLDTAAADRSEIQMDYRYLALADALSLAYCTRRTVPWKGQSVTALVEGDILHLEPFPLAGTTTFQIPVRRIPNRPYSTDTQIGSALARARWDHLPVKVAPC